jgi:hypothetical protein
MTPICVLGRTFPCRRTQRVRLSRVAPCGLAGEGARLGALVWVGVKTRRFEHRLLLQSDKCLNT